MAGKTCPPSSPPLIFSPSPSTLSPNRRKISGRRRPQSPARARASLQKCAKPRPCFLCRPGEISSRFSPTKSCFPSRLRGLHDLRPRPEARARLSPARDICQSDLPLSARKADRCRSPYETFKSPVVLTKNPRAIEAACPCAFLYKAPISQLPASPRGLDAKTRLAIDRDLIPDRHNENSCLTTALAVIVGRFQCPTRLTSSCRPFVRRSKATRKKAIPIGEVPA